MPISIEAMIEPIRHSPRLVEVVDALRDQIREERLRRQAFYEEMTPDQKLEFIDGAVVLHSQARNLHLDATKRIAVLMDAFVESRRLGELKIEKCLCVFPRNDYEPDIAYFGPSKTETLDDHTMKFPVPDLVVEVVSESTEHRDRGVKFEDYEAHKVGEYWIVDAERATIEQYVLRANGYELVLKSGTGELRSVVLEGFEMPVRAAFSKRENLATLRELLAEQPPGAALSRPNPPAQR